MALHPLIAQILQATAGLPRPFNVPLAAARAGFRKRIALLPPAGEPLAAVVDLQIGPAERRIPSRLYRPVVEAPAPLAVFFHGGGFVIGDLETHDGLCRRLCARSRCCVLSVDYRLAPEHPFPAAVEDAWMALRWATAHAADLGADPTRLLLAGDSAGGNLAAATALLCRDHAGPRIGAQVLIYPTLQHYSAPSGSYDEMGSGYGLTRETMIWFWNQYLPDASARTDPRAVPLSAASHAGLPPTLVITAEYDLLRDEGERYAQALREAGVEARVSRYAGMNHGFVGLAGLLDDADRAIEEACAWLRGHAVAASGAS